VPAFGLEACVDRADDPSPDDRSLPLAFGPHPLMLDPLGPVAEFATSNIWIVRDGVAITPAANGSFLAGITRLRLIGLLRGDGVPVVEKTVTIDAVRSADEIFSSGNYGKVQPVTRFEDRALQPGPVYARARTLPGFRPFPPRGGVAEATRLITASGEKHPCPMLRRYHPAVITRRTALRQSMSGPGAGSRHGLRPAALRSRSQCSGTPR
jgi:hypothetical protein